MLGIIGIVFIAAFAIAVLMIWVGNSDRRQQTQQTVRRLASLVAAATDISDDVLELRRPQHLSTIPWVDRLLLRAGVFPRLRLLLYQADSKWTVGTLMLYMSASWATVALLVYWRTGAALMAFAIGLAGGAAPLLYVSYKRSARLAAFERILPDALDLIVGALRAGHSLTSSIGMVGKEMPQPVSGEFRKCFDEQMFGIETRTAMLNLATRVPIQPVRIIATAVMIQKESGGNLAEVLEKAAYVIRERTKLRRQVSVHTAQGRLTGWILSLLPVVLGIGLYFVSPEYVSLLWKNPLGLKMLYGALILCTIGMLVIRKIVNIRI
jgi:tight adherence protein B